MQTTTFILLIKVTDKSINARELLESIEGKTLINVEVNETKIRDHLIKTLDASYLESTLSVWGMSDYMDAFNDTDDDVCELDIDTYFMGYVKV